MNNLKIKQFTKQEKIDAVDKLYTKWYITYKDRNRQVLLFDDK